MIGKLRDVIGIVVGLQRNKNMAMVCVCV